MQSTPETRRSEICDELLSQKSVQEERDILIEGLYNKLAPILGPSQPMIETEPGEEPESEMGRQLREITNQGRSHNTSLEDILQRIAL